MSISSNFALTTLHVEPGEQHSTAVTVYTFFLLQTSLFGTLDCVHKTYEIMYGIFSVLYLRQVCVVVNVIAT